MLLSLLLFSAGVLLALAALVERPDDSHGHAEAAASTGETEDHGAVSEALTDDGAEDIGASAGSSRSDSDHPADGHEEQTRSILGVDRNSLNLVFPWWTIIVIALTIVLASALAAKMGAGLLLATVGIGLTGVAVGIAEALHAGEELGIFVPLPILAAVLYGGAGSLAMLALIAARSEPVAAPAD